MLPETKICIASVSKAHGIRGHLRIRTFLQDPSDLEQYKTLFFEDGSLFQISKILRYDKGSAIVIVDGVSDRNMADALKGKSLYIDREDLPDLDEETFYHTDLIGLAVKNEEGDPIGKVKYVHDHGAGTILEIFDPQTQNSVLVPFRDESVPEVDLLNKCITVHSSYLDELL